MDEPQPAGDEPSDPPQPDERRRIPRRWFLAGGLALVAGAGVGVGVGFAQSDRERPQVLSLPPATLRAAIADERTLVAAAHAALASRTVADDVASTLLRDHRAHLAALLAAAASYRRTTSRPAAGSAQLDRSALAELERHAEIRSSSRAARLAGSASSAPLATLLASIAACEATHVVLLADSKGMT